MDMSLSKLWERAKDQETWSAAVHGVAMNENTTWWLQRVDSKVRTLVRSECRGGVLYWRGSDQFPVWWLVLLHTECKFYKYFSCSLFNEHSLKERRKLIKRALSNSWGERWNILLPPMVTKERERVEKTVICWSTSICQELSQKLFHLPVTIIPLKWILRFFFEMRKLRFREMEWFSKA